MKKYRLLKDLPGVKAGAIYEQRFCTEKDRYYFYEHDSNIVPDNICLAFPGWFIEKNPEWFEEIQKKDKKKEFTKEDLFSFAEFYSKRNSKDVLPNDILLLGWAMQKWYLKK